LSIIPKLRLDTVVWRVAEKRLRKYNDYADLEGMEERARWREFADASTADETGGAMGGLPALVRYDTNCTAGKGGQAA